MKKFFLTVVTLISVVFSVSALDMSVRDTPAVVFPMQDKMVPAYGDFLNFDFVLFDLINAGVEAGLINELPANATEGVFFFHGGLGVSAYYNLFSRLYLSAGLGTGLYTMAFSRTDDEGETKDYTTTDLYYKAYGEVGFRINPVVTLSGTGGYIAYNIKDSVPVMSGPYAGVSVKINFSTGKNAKSACYANISQEGDIYPLFQQVYRFSPVATATIVNGESAEIRNVSISFRAGKYTSSALQSDVIPMIKKMQSYEVPLTVDFSSELLRFSENGRISGELVIEYELLGRKKTTVQSVSFAVSNRNTYVWGNNESIAAFISPDTPEILEYAKYVAGVARNDLYTGMNRNLQFAAAMFEALKSSGLTLNSDKTPYVKYHLSDEADYIQYPLQTMDFSSGDLDELGILYASCLESVGVETAVLPLKDDFLVLVGLGVNPSAAGNHFGDVNTLAITEDNVFFALSMAEFTKGFVRSRAQGAKLVAQCNADEEGEYEFISTRAAWSIYPPAVFTGSGEALPKPSQAEIQRLTKAAVQDYINTDLVTVINNARASGDSNKLGIAYVRAGRYADAKAEFSKGANNGNVSAINNLANIYIMEKNYSGAAAQYRRALQIDPANKTAKKGLDNASSKLAE